MADRLEHLVLDPHLLGGAPRLLWMLGRDQRHGLAPVPYEVEGEHRLVVDLEPVELLARHVLMCEDRHHSGHRARLGRVDGHDSRVRMGAAHRRAPQHPVDMQV